MNIENNNETINTADSDLSKRFCMNSNLSASSFGSTTNTPGSSLSNLSKVGLYRPESYSSSTCLGHSYLNKIKKKNVERK